MTVKLKEIETRLRFTPGYFEKQVPLGCAYRFDEDTEVTISAPILIPVLLLKLTYTDVSRSDSVDFFKAVMANGKVFMKEIKAIIAKERFYISLELIPTLEACRVIVKAKLITVAG